MKNPIRLTKATNKSVDEVTGSAISNSPIHIEGFSIDVFESKLILI